LRKWLLIGASVVVLLFVTLYVIGVAVIAPKLREGARQRTQDYLSKKFKSTVEIADFHPRCFRGFAWRSTASCCTMKDGPISRR
jgi:p-aminobenzoyl-glutamate transporter AbgT